MTSVVGWDDICSRVGWHFCCCDLFFFAGSTFWLLESYLSYDCQARMLYNLHGQCHKNVDPNMYRQYFRIVPCTYLPWSQTQHPLFWVIVLCTYLLWTRGVRIPTCYAESPCRVQCTYLMWSQTLIFYAESLHYVNSCCGVSWNHLCWFSWSLWI